MAVSKFGPGVADIFLSFERIRFTLSMAWSDTRARYKRSVLGPFWLTLSTAIGVVGLGFVWSAILNTNRAEFIPSLTIGLILWQMLSSGIVEGANVFNAQAGLIKNVNLPYFTHPLQLMMRQLINFIHNFVVFIVIALILKVEVNESTLWFIPGFLLFVGNLQWMMLFCGILGARFRDVQYAINAILPLLFFLTPVMFRAKSLPFTAQFIWLNPLSYMIEVVRDPLLGAPPPTHVLLVSCLMLVFGWLLTCLLFNRARHRIAFWV